MGRTGSDVAGLADAVRRGDRSALARAITLVESTRGDHREQCRREDTRPG